jgi:hypothetical protein
MGRQYYKVMILSSVLYINLEAPVAKGTMKRENIWQKTLFLFRGVPEKMAIRALWRH